MKNNAVTKVFELSKLKKVAAAHTKTLGGKKCTVNDVVMALLSISMREYMRSKGDYDAQSLNMLVPFSFRALPRTREELAFENDFSALCFTLRFGGTFEEALKIVEANTTALKKSIYPFGLLALQQLIAWFPGIVG